jgi:hypothetical protein
MENGFWKAVKTKKVPFLITMVVMAVAVLMTNVERRAVAKLRQDKLELQTVASEANSLNAQNSRLAELRVAAAKADRLRLETKDLFKMRNEVHELREQQSNLAKLRMQNQRLRKLANGVNASTEQIQAIVPFITSSELSDQGQATPEAAVQTMIWSFRTGNIQRSKECMLEPETFIPTNMPPEKLAEDLKSGVAGVRGLRIVKQTQINPDEIELTVQVLEDGIDGLNEMALKGKRIGSQWKFAR